ncbi:hypothetical protein D9758_016832 [Tetrapyrgos nigripes]|uniref:Beta-glucuronidase C-terminal domain-containing protein n=1 Tax=Tetrapyrgos nigripes TaxID=182062 RepID=A0A8H5C9G4_9AGAR|nr:hypothetical protein D9758_016832 [Tetrapyrgos nigripes]
MSGNLDAFQDLCNMTLCNLRYLTVHPAYAIYKNNIPICVALINFMTDNSGTSAYTASISISGGNTGQPTSTPSSVKVKYLSTSNVSQKANFTWAGQTFGDHFASDERPMGEESIQTIQCDSTSNTVSPCFALIFLNDKALERVQMEKWRRREVTMKTMNTATIDQEVLATSNGHQAGDLVGWMGSMLRRSSGVWAGRGVKCMDMSMVVMGMISMQVFWASAPHLASPHSSKEKTCGLCWPTSKAWAVQRKYEDWSKVIWSDKCYAHMGDSQGWVFVTCHADEIFEEDCLIPSFKQSLTQVMVWGCMMKGRKVMGPTLA